jgi:hypothetical protein
MDKNKLIEAGNAILDIAAKHGVTHAHANDDVRDMSNPDNVWNDEDHIIDKKRWDEIIHASDEPCKHKTLRKEENNMRRVRPSNVVGYAYYCVDCNEGHFHAEQINFTPEDDPAYRGGDYDGDK